MTIADTKKARALPGFEGIRKLLVFQNGLIVTRQIVSTTSTSVIGPELTMKPETVSPGDLASLARRPVWAPWMPDEDDHELGDEPAILMRPKQPDQREAGNPGEGERGSDEIAVEDDGRSIDARRIGAGRSDVAEQEAVEQHARNHDHDADQVERLYRSVVIGHLANPFMPQRGHPGDA